MAMDSSMKFERTKQEVAEHCLKLFEKLYRFGSLSTEFEIEMSAKDRSTGEIRAMKTSVVIPESIPYDVAGQLTGRVQSYQVSISHDGNRHFRAMLNGELHEWLSQGFVEQELRIPVHKKGSGSQVGYPSESQCQELFGDTS